VNDGRAGMGDGLTKLKREEMKDGEIKLRTPEG
jgi:hypothetical protein